LSSTVLIVEDEPSHLEVARAYLERAGYRTLACVDGEQALSVARQERPDLVVLDLMLPGLPGQEVCRELRSVSDVPILMLTAKSDEEDRLAGLEMGADDYLVKPFSPRELVARVRAVLRRTKSDAAPLRERLLLDGGRVEIDFGRREVRRVGVQLQLTASEYRLLEALGRYPGRVYSRDELVERLSDDDELVLERTIDSHIKNLRQKLGDDPRRPRCIETVYGMGYRLIDRR
jgi:two-component system response regulator RegX3